jgi:hypothetical protein
VRVRVLGPWKPWVTKDAQILSTLPGLAVEHRSYLTRRDFFREAVRRTDLTVIWLAGYGSGWWARLPGVLRGKTVAVWGGGELRPDTERFEGQRAYMPHLLRTLEYFDAHVFTGPHLLEVVARRGWPVPKEFAVSLPAVDAGAFRIAEKQPRTAALVGPFHSIVRLTDKGYPRLLQLAADTPDWTFHLVGVPTTPQVYGIDTRPVLDALSRLPDNIVPVPYQTDHAKAEAQWGELAGRMQANLILGHWEGGPMTLFEGLMAGCAPIVGDGVVHPGGGPYLPLKQDLDAVMKEAESPERYRERALQLTDVSVRRAMWEALLPRLP